MSVCDCGVSGCGLAQRAHDRLAGERHLEVVRALALRAREQQVGRFAEGAVAGLRSRQSLLCGGDAPGLVGDAAERDARLRDRFAVDAQRDGDRDQREGVGQSVAQLEIGVVRVEGLCGQVDGSDQLALLQRVVDRGLAAGSR